MDLQILPKNRIKGEIKIPADKSISHRAIMLSAIAKGKSYINNLLQAEDVLCTINCFKELGVNISKIKNQYIVEGKGKFLNKPSKTLYAGNSGTTMRLILGILAGQNFTSSIIGDASLNNRPMERVIKPLSLMGAKFTSCNGKPPIEIKGKYPLKSITYQLPIPSAQVKSAILLAALFTHGETKIIEKIKSRDHTERMLKIFNANIKKENEIISISPEELTATEISIPNDISSAAYFIAAALITNGSHIIIRNIGINPTRTGFIKILIKMGANIKILNKRYISNEPVADIEVRSSSLKPVRISGRLIPTLIDELPIIAVLATQIDGETIIENAEELRVKETDRIRAMTDGLKKLGGNVEEQKDGMIIKGKTKLKSALVDSYYDHRTAMALSIAGLIAKDGVIIKNAECIRTSFPEFINILKSL